MDTLVHREVGIPMALGAVRRDMLALIVEQAMVPVAYGIAAGLALGLMLARVLASLPDDAQGLFGVTATDPLTFAACQCSWTSSRSWRLTSLPGERHGWIRW